MIDMISRAELFNKLATINAPMEANDYKAEVYQVINEMETHDVVKRERVDDFVKALCRGILPECLVDETENKIMEKF